MSTSSFLFRKLYSTSGWFQILQHTANAFRGFDTHLNIHINLYYDVYKCTLYNGIQWCTIIDKLDGLLSIYHKKTCRYVELEDYFLCMNYVVRRCTLYIQVFTVYTVQFTQEYTGWRIISTYRQYTSTVFSMGTMVYRDVQGCTGVYNLYFWYTVRIFYHVYAFVYV